jgi:hypothetical protein
MKQKTIYTLAIICCFLFSTSCVQANKEKQTEETPSISNQKIQAAILLDVSNSMDGLIDQAKAQLWNMVSTMGKAKCNGATPKIEIALYEYGRTTNNEKAGFVKQLMPFTTDLDSLSQILFCRG